MNCWTDWKQSQFVSIRPPIDPRASRVSCDDLLHFKRLGSIDSADKLEERRGSWPQRRSLYSFKSRFDTGTGTNPEELIAAAHAGCFSMAFANALAEAGFTATQVKTTATVHLDPAAEGGPAVTKIHLVCESVVPNIDKAKYEEIAVNAKTGCPISKLLKAAEITLDANLI